MDHDETKRSQKNHQDSIRRDQDQVSSPGISGPQVSLLTIAQCAAIDPSSLTPVDIKQLQKTMGNAAVGQLFNTSTPQAETPNKENLDGNAIKKAPPESLLVKEEEKEPIQVAEVNHSGMPDKVKDTADGEILPQVPKRVLQRKVGLEFQTSGCGPNVFVRKGDQYVKNKEHGSKIGNGEGFEVTADFSELEYVTDAFEENEAGRERLSGTMDRIQAYTEILIEHSKSEKPVKSDKAREAAAEKFDDINSKSDLAKKESLEKELKDKKEKLKSYQEDPENIKDPKTQPFQYGQIQEKIKEYSDSIDEINTKIKSFENLIALWGAAKEVTVIKKTGEQPNEQYKIYLPKDVTAHPQSTVGVKLEKIFDLLQSLSDKRRGENEEDPNGVESEKDLIGWGSYPGTKQREAVQGGVDAINNKFQYKSKSLKGFLALIASYARGAKATALKKETIPNAKDVMPVMSRTSLAEIFKMLDAKDQKAFGELVESKNELKEILDRKYLTKPLFKNIEKSEEYKINFAIIDWLTALSQGKDLLTESGEDAISKIDRNHAEYEKKDNTKDDTKKYTKDKYGIDRPTDIGLGKNVDGAIMELRAIKRKVHYTKWKDTALAVFDLVQVLNETKTQPVNNQQPDDQKNDTKI